MDNFSRRAFLQRLGIAGLGILSACRANMKLGNRKRRPMIVVGGGHGGATAAKYLRLLDPSLDVILVEQTSSYLACPGSNEVLAGLLDERDLRRDYRGLQSKYGISLVTGRAVGVDTKTRTLKLEDGSSLPYERLVMSPGIDFRWDALEGYDEAASAMAPHAWKAGPQTLLLRNQIQAMPDGGTVLISVPANPYRCPPGPYERASLMAHYLSRHKPRSKILILDAKTKFSKQKPFQAGWQALYPGMIEWISSEKEGRIDRIDVARGIVHTEFGRHRGDVLNIIPPQKAGKLAEWCGLTDASGWCPINPVTFESTLVPGIHVVGDACIADPMPKSAFAANSQAKICAAAIVSLLNGHPPQPPFLINHCYSFVSPEEAISITGVYEYSPEEHRLAAVSTGETPLDGNRRLEADYARHWRQVFARDVFG